MHIQKVSQQFLTMFPVLLFLACPTRAAAPEPIDGAEEVLATAAEIDFINRVIDQVKASVPPIDGWERSISVTTSEYPYRDGAQLMIFEGVRKFPLHVSIRLDFKTITEADRQRAVEEKSAETLEKEMMAAAESGDMEKLQQLQLQLMASLQSQMEAGPIGQAAGLSPVTPVENPTKFYVQVIVNGNGEHIGKNYDIVVPGVAKAFRIDKGNDDHLGYKYYMGAWEVSEFDAKNWRIVSPVAAQTPANHLRAIVLFANVAGDRDSVEEYVANSMDREGLNSALD